MAEASSYKDTVRLPNTSFSMRANLKQLGEATYKKWQNEDIYGQLREQNKNKPKFILHNGPPYANGHIHLGTAFNQILKDILVKGVSLLGYNAPLVLGWDCHGLPIEWKVEENYRKKGVNKNNIDVIEFRKECRNFADSWLQKQKEEFKTLGIIADFNNPYITMDYKSESLIYKEITKLIMNNGIYLGKKPVMWSVVEQTVLAEAEIEYHNKVSDTLCVGFKVIKAPQQEWLNAKIVIWTTTPWTLPANRALAYGPNIIYGLFEIEEVSEDAYIKKGEKLILATDLAEKIFSDAKILKYKKLSEIKGLEGFEANHTLYDVGFNYNVSALAADFVDIEVGTGIVHCAPAYGEDDFKLGKQYNLNLTDLLNDNGTYKEDVPFFAGMHIFKVASVIAEKLQESGNLVVKSQITHSYPHSWRSKAPVIFRLTSQWFLNLNNNNCKEKALNAISNDIVFLPKTGKNRLFSMVKERPDWCLSRQRIWGVPLAMFINIKTEELLKDEEVNNAIIKAFEEEGADVWFKGDPKRFLPSKYNKNDYKAIYDIVDVWFDSGCTHEFVLNQRENLKKPADVYFEGSDQHRGWFQSSLLESLAVGGDVPFKTIITHGYVLDQKGLKMSKSIGNVVNPFEVLDKFGLDILRLWVTNSDYKEDVKVGDDILKQQVDIYKKIRNTLRYMIGNLSYYKSELNVAYDNLEELEKWLLHKVVVLNNSFKNTFTKSYDFHTLFNEIHNFITIELSAFYFDIRKDALYCDFEGSNIFKSALTVINIVFDYLVKWLSPFISVTAEEAFMKNGAENSILLEELKPVQSEWTNETIFNKWERIKQIRKVVMKSLEIKRSEKVIGSSLEAHPIVYLKNEDMQLLSNIDFATVCITSGITIKPFESATEKSLELQEVNGVKVDFDIQKGKKCPRCWKITDTYHKDDLCDRCYNVVIKSSL